MRFGNKRASLVAIAVTVLTGTVACSSSSKPALTIDQVSTQLLTAKDEPGWNFEPLEDARSAPDVRDTVTSGGSGCQTFLDAHDLSSTRYGTTDTVTRTFTHTSGNDNLLDHVAVMPSKAKAAALMSDLSSGLKDCKSYASTGFASTITVEADAGAPAGHVIFTTSAISGADTLVITTDMVQVGEEVVVISYLGNSTDNSATMQQTVSHASEVQAARLKAAQG